MKRTVCLVILLTLLLSGCGGTEKEPAPLPALSTEAPRSAETEAPDAAPAVVPQPFSDADTAAMSRYMSVNRALIDGNTLYTMEYDENLRPVLAQYFLRSGVPGAFRVLCTDCVPEYLTLADGCLYFLHEGSLQRYDLKSRKRETMFTGPIRSLQIFDGAIYLTDEEGRYMRTDMDGSGGELLLEGGCDYAWAMSEGFVYQSENEGATLRMRLWSGEDRQLTAAASYAPLRLGERIWYSQKDAEGSVPACVDLGDGRVTRSGGPAMRGAVELVPVGDEWMLRVLLDEDGVYKQRLVRPGETEGEDCGYSGYRLCDYVGEHVRVDAAYEADGRLRYFVLVDAEGGETRYFGGKVLD